MVELLRRAWAEAKKRLADDPALLADVAWALGLLLSRAGDMGLAAEALRWPRRDPVQLPTPDSRSSSPMHGGDKT